MDWQRLVWYLCRFHCLIVFQFNLCKKNFMWASSISSHESSLFILDFILQQNQKICDTVPPWQYKYIPEKNNATALVQCLSWKQMQDWDNRETHSRARLHRSGHSGTVSCDKSSLPSFPFHFVHKAVRKRKTQNGKPWFTASSEDLDL